MKKNALMVCFMLAGCSALVHPSADSSVCPMEGEADDAGPANDAGVVDQTGLTALGACMWVEGIWREKMLEGTIDGAACPQVHCPFPFDITGRTRVTCSAADVEACAWALERANTCVHYQDAIASCATDSCL